MEPRDAVARRDVQAFGRDLLTGADGAQSWDEATRQAVLAALLDRTHGNATFADEIRAAAPQWTSGPRFADWLAAL